MTLEESIAAIEVCETIDALRATMHRTVQAYGFAAFGFVDAGKRDRSERPFYIGTGGERWEQDYLRNDFASVDPCLAIARRTNIPFAWHSVPLPERTGRRLPGALKVMQAARDQGFRDGLNVPFHFKDREGRYHSSSAVFFWKSSLDKFNLVLRERRTDLHLLMLYFMQRAIDLIATESRNAEAVFRHGVRIDAGRLSDRERDVLSWAARGMTVQATADKLRLSDDTVETHIRSAMRKLNASNKTHATVMALHLGLIDL